MFNAELDSKLSAQEKQKVLDQIKKTKGVFAASFTKAAKKTTVSVHAGMPSVENDVRKIPGVKKITPDNRMRM